MRERPVCAPATRPIYDYALELFSANRLDDARAVVEAALRADPDMADAHHLLGSLLAGSRHLPAAAKEYTRAIELQPDLARAHPDLARVLADQGDVPGAIEQLKKAAAGSDPAVARLAAQALQRIGK